VKDDTYVSAVKTDYTKASLSSVDRALCDFALKLTKTPGAMTAQDVQTLRSEGLDDRAINDAVQIISYFNYINRIADGLEVDLEPEMRR